MLDRVVSCVTKFWEERSFQTRSLSYFPLILYCSESIQKKKLIKETFRKCSHTKQNAWREIEGRVELLELPFLGFNLKWKTLANYYLTVDFSF